MPTLRATLINQIYAARKARSVHPEGTFDRARRWYPDAREDCDGDGSRTRTPSAAWPFSYMLRCRTRQHCAALVAAAIVGRDVPEDVRRALAALSAAEIEQLRAADAATIASAHVVAAEIDARVVA